MRERMADRRTNGNLFKRGLWTKKRKNLARTWDKNNLVNSSTGLSEQHFLLSSCKTAQKQRGGIEQEMTLTKLGAAIRKEDAFTLFQFCIVARSAILAVFSEGRYWNCRAICLMVHWTGTAKWFYFLPDPIFNLAYLFRLVLAPRLDWREPVFEAVS